MDLQDECKVAVSVTCNDEEVTKPDQAGLSINCEGCNWREDAFIEVIICFIELISDEICINYRATPLFMETMATATWKLES